MKFSKFFYLVEQRNTLAADVNEILVGFYALGGRFDKRFVDSKGVQKQMNLRKAEIGEKEFNDQDGRAQIMAFKSLEWAAKNGYSGKVKKVWWTARPGILAKAVGQPVDSRKNPTDTLFQFSDGKFLGISAKSTKGQGDIGFKNPGIGTLARALKIDLAEIVAKREAKIVKALGLPAAKNARKKFIRSKEKIQIQTVAEGTKILNKLRNVLLKTLSGMSQNKLRKHILDQWLDVDKDIFPYYIKVTGKGKNGNYSADILDPLKNPKIRALNNNKIVLSAVGNDSVGVMAGKRILKMRFKYESEKIASTVKLSGDHWA